MFVKTVTPSPSLDALGPASTGVPVIDTNSLRQAALHKSWQRDQRVARKRLAVRWVLWWLWKCRYVLMALCAVLAYLFYRFEHAEHPSAPVIAPVITPAETTATEASPPQSDMHLRMQPQLLEPNPGLAREAKADLLPTNTQPIFQLKPETQLKIKETNP
jgi:hypothetical protein